MKRSLLAMLLACCSLWLLAQDAIPVKYKGSKPAITDFAGAFFASTEDVDECGMEAINAIKYAFNRYRKGLPQEEDVTFSVDEKNGFILYEWRQESALIRMEMCYWNESDGKHKLFAYNNMASFDEEGPIVTETSCLTFWRYNNATKKMTYCSPPGFEVDYSNITYALPRSGKDIVVTVWNADGSKTEKTLKWDGRKFSF